MTETERLRAAGYVDAGRGNVLLEGPAAELHERWRRTLRKRLASGADLVIAPPLFTADRILRASRYGEHFPQQLVVAAGRARPRTSAQTVTPAACLHVYPRQAGKLIDGRGHTAYVEARCARFEAGRWRFPFRLSGFGMVERVVAGGPPAVEAAARAGESLAGDLFAQAGFAGAWRAAADPFFGAGGAAVLQRLRGSKREYRVPLARGDLALASVNRHDDTFGRQFRIRTGPAVPAHSMCLAFGLERLVAYGLLTWGPDARRWPRAFAQ